jgi:hypothetical protein
MASRERPGGAAFRLRYTLTVLYLFAFVLLYCLAIAVPAMLEVLRELPPGPDQQAASREAVRAVVGPRLLLALGAAVLTTVFGARARLLPGLR